MTPSNNSDYYNIISNLLSIELHLSDKFMSNFRYQYLLQPELVLKFANVAAERSNSTPLSGLQITISNCILFLVAVKIICVNFAKSCTHYFVFLSDVFLRGRMYIWC